MTNFLSPFLCLFLCVLSLPIFSQEQYVITGDRAALVRLLGTSTLHDWEMEATDVTGSATFTFRADQQLTGLPALTFSLDVKDLHSDSRGMDKNAYEALEADTYKRIHYVLSSATLSPETGGYLVKSRGELTIAGTTRDIDMDVHLTVAPDGTITCRGTYALKMTDYGVKPPTFFLGAMKCGDDLTLEFSVTYRNAAGV